MTDAERWAALLRDRRFWLAIVAVVQAVVFELWPGFPDAIWQSLLLLSAVVIAGMTVTTASMNQTRATGQIIAKLLEMYGGQAAVVGSDHITEAIIDEALANWGK